jgi:GT2 family glycosyltransferase
MRLTVVIVNYNVKFYLEQCLRSLYKSLDGVCAEVHVVDNASTDGSEKYIKELFPKVIYTYNTSNIGFAGACNIAIRRSSAEYILLLNPDTILPESNIKEVLDYMESDTGCGGCGVRMITSDGSFLPESKRGYPTLSAAFFKLTGIYKLLSNDKSDGYYLSNLDKDKRHEVPVLAGAYMMLRASVLKVTGPLDEDYFMFGEDIDLSCKITDAGYHNCYLPTSILHYKGESTVHTSYSYIKNFYGAMAIFVRKHDKGSFIRKMSIIAAIHSLMYTKRRIAMAQRTLGWLFMTNRVPTPRMLVFAAEHNISAILTILRQNGIDGGCLCVAASERSAQHIGHTHLEHGKKFTHVLYDSESYSYKRMIELMESNAPSGLGLAIYHKCSQVIVTPEHVYTLN